MWNTRSMASAVTFAARALKQRIHSRPLTTTYLLLFFRISNISHHRQSRGHRVGHHIGGRTTFPPIFGGRTQVSRSPTE
jgi:hypothetical protein